MASKRVTVTLIVMNPDDSSLDGAREYVKMLGGGGEIQVAPIPGKPVGTHIEDKHGNNIGLSSLNPPMRANSVFIVEEFHGYRTFERLGPDLPGTHWAVVVDVTGRYEPD